MCTHTHTLTPRLWHSPRTALWARDAYWTRSLAIRNILGCISPIRSILMPSTDKLCTQGTSSPETANGKTVLCLLSACLLKITVPSAEIHAAQTPEHTCRVGRRDTDKKQQAGPSKRGSHFINKNHRTATTTTTKIIKQMKCHTKKQWVTLPYKGTFLCFCMTAFKVYLFPFCQPEA